MIRWGFTCWLIEFLAGEIVYRYFAADICDFLIPLRTGLMGSTPFVFASAAYPNKNAYCVFESSSLRALRLSGLLIV